MNELNLLAGMLNKATTTGAFNLMETQDISKALEALAKVLNPQAKTEGVGPSPEVLEKV